MSVILRRISPIFRPNTVLWQFYPSTGGCCRSHLLIPENSGNPLSGFSTPPSEKVRRLKSTVSIVSSSLVFTGIYIFRRQTLKGAESPSFLRCAQTASSSAVKWFHDCAYCPEGANAAPIAATDFSYLLFHAGYYPNGLLRCLLSFVVVYVDAFRKLLSRYLSVHLFGASGGCGQSKTTFWRRVTTCGEGIQSLFDFTARFPLQKQESSQKRKIRE